MRIKSAFELYDRDSVISKIEFAGLTQFTNLGDVRNIGFYREPDGGCWKIGTGETPKHCNRRCFAVPTPPFIQHETRDTVCLGQSTNLTTDFKTVLCGPEFTYKWTSDPPGVTGSDSILNISPSANMAVFLELKARNQYPKEPATYCFFYDTLRLIVVPPPSFTFKPIPQETCTGDTVHIQVDTLLFPNWRDYQWEWRLNSGTIVRQNHPLEADVVWRTSGVQTGALVSRKYGCDFDARFTINITEPPYVKLLAERDSLCLGDSVHVLNNIPKDPDTRYEWISPPGDHTFTQDSMEVLLRIRTRGDHPVILTAWKGSCISADTVNLTVLTWPEAGIILPRDTICTGDSIRITNAGALNGAKPVWRYEDGVGQANRDTLVVFWSTPGEKQVILTLQHPLCPAADTTTVTILKRPVAMLAARQDSICTGELLQVYNTGDPADATPEWRSNFGDVVNDTLGFITDVPGEYWVVLTLHHPLCPAQDSILLTVRPRPAAHIEATPTTLCVGDEAKLYNIAENNGAVLYWRFDGQELQADTLTVSWPKAGAEQVILELRHPLCPTSDTTIVTVIDRPVVTLVSDKPEFCTSDSISVENTAPIVIGDTYVWNFAGATQRDVEANRSYILHADAQGLVQVTASVQNAACTAADTLKVQAYLQPTTLISGNRSRLCDFDTLTVTRPHATEPTMQFTWDFGGAAVDSSTNAYRCTWPDTGAKVIRLLVVNGPCIWRDSLQIHKYPTPKGAVSVNVANPCVNDTVLLWATYTPARVTGFTWELDGGSGDGTDTVRTTWTTPGLKIVRLQLADTSTGCADTAVHAELNVRARPVVELRLDSTERPCESAEYAIEAVRVDAFDREALHYDWTFGTAEVLNTPPPYGPYRLKWAEIGPKPVSVIVALQDGCPADAVSVTIDYTVQRLLGYTFSLPNVFTPNGDGVNDRFRLLDYTPLCVDYDLLIFDRWGKKLFTLPADGAAWDGQYNSAPAPAGVYFYVLNLRKDGRKAAVTGQVTLLR